MPHVQLHITNVYADEEVVTVVDTEVPPAPDPQDEAAWEEWTSDHIFIHTGTGREHGDSAYFVTVQASSDPALVGREFEFGV